MKKVAPLIAVLLGVFSLISGARRALSPAGNIDFHAYWYAGEHLRQRRNPYLAYQNAIYVEPPLTNIDSSDLRWTVSYADKSFTPANTAPLLLLIAPLSYFTWQNAQIIWLVINLQCILLIPLLAIRLYHINNHSVLSGRSNFPIGLTITVLFLSLAATRLTLAVGQTSLVVITLLLGAVLMASIAERDDSDDRRAPMIGAAIMLGIALSKYSLALPILLYFVIRRQWKIVLGSLLVQLIGLLLQCGITRSSPVDTFFAYGAIMRTHVGHSGIHLASLLPSSLFWRLFAVAVVTLPVIYVGIRRKQTVLSLLALLSVWTLLVAYHRAYDVVLIIFAIPFLCQQASTFLERYPLGFMLPVAIFLPLIIGQSTLVTLSLLILLGWLLYAPVPLPDRVL